MNKDVYTDLRRPSTERPVLPTLSWCCRTVFLFDLEKQSVSEWISVEGGQSLNSFLQWVEIMTSTGYALTVCDFLLSQSLPMTKPVFLFMHSLIKWMHKDIDGKDCHHSTVFRIARQMSIIEQTTVNQETNSGTVPATKAPVLPSTRGMCFWCWF